MKILGKEVEVKQLKIDSHLLGFFTPEPKLKIRIQEKLKGKQRIRILLHEAFHAAMSISGINSVVDPAIEEQIVTMLENHAEDIIKEVKRHEW